MHFIMGKLKQTGSLITQLPQYKKSSTTICADIGGIKGGIA